MFTVGVYIIWIPFIIPQLKRYNLTGFLLMLVTYWAGKDYGIRYSMKLGIATLHFEGKQTILINHIDKWN